MDKQSGIIVLIPAYKPDARMVELVRELRDNHLDVMLVDDGGQEPYAPLFAQCRELGAEVAVHTVNLGKGRALKTGINAALLRWPDLRAIVTADAVSTVSETYAQELQYPYFSHGMSSVLTQRASSFYGITNGIDTTVFDPQKSGNIPFHYTAKTMVEQKAKNKQALQLELGLNQDPDATLFAIVSRLAGHKGVDLLSYIAHTLLSRPVQLAIIGTGEAQYEQALSELARQYPGRMVVRLAFDPSLADRVYAGADAYLMPSRSEPCGLSQLIAMHYGTIPVVHATGGLRDTVPPYDPTTGEGRGFTFQSYNGEDFMGAIDRALQLYYDDRAAWNALAQKDMDLDVSWKVPAQAYMDMFHKVTGING